MPGEPSMSRAAALSLAALSLAACSTLETAQERSAGPPQRCAPQTVQIYFEPDSAEVTPEGRAVIAQAARQAQGCLVDTVRVTGLADAAGAPEPNLELSRRRAQSVTAALASSGLPAAEFDLEAVGQDGAVAPDGSKQPLRRRADVVLTMKPRT
jgi:outer membrane protein OmpA-like peptidoglycan-associated protein